MHWSSQHNTRSARCTHAQSLQCKAQAYAEIHGRPRCKSTTYRIKSSRAVLGASTSWPLVREVRADQASRHRHARLYRNFIISDTKGECEKSSRAALSGDLCDMRASHHRQAITRHAGDVFSWGCNLRSQCGPFGDTHLPAPQRIGALAGIRIVAVAAGLSHSLACCENGGVYGWGANDVGQVGIVDQATVQAPTLLEASGLDEAHVVEVACGSRCRPCQM